MSKKQHDISYIVLFTFVYFGTLLGGLFSGSVFCAKTEHFSFDISDSYI